MLDRINNPDLTVKFELADKPFSTGGGAINNKTANVKAFAFSKSANLRDGFHTKNFTGAKGFSTQAYAGNKDASVAKRSFGETDRGYATHDLAGVHEARDAGKTMATREYTAATGKEPFVPHGKSQGTIDALMQEKNLTIDQVRELLNKNK